MIIFIWGKNIMLSTGQIYQKEDKCSQVFMEIINDYSGKLYLTIVPRTN